MKRNTVDLKQCNGQSVCVFQEVGVFFWEESYFSSSLRNRRFPFPYASLKQFPKFCPSRSNKQLKTSRVKASSPGGFRLLNIAYKDASKVIATTLEMVSNYLISLEHTSFVKGKILDQSTMSQNKQKYRTFQVFLYSLIFAKRSTLSNETLLKKSRSVRFWRQYTTMDLDFLF